MQVSPIFKLMGALKHAVIYLDLRSSFLSPGHRKLFNLKLITRIILFKVYRIIRNLTGSALLLMMSVQIFRVCFLDHDREGTARFFIASA